jgi:hypothetical protein
MMPCCSCVACAACKSQFFLPVVMLPAAAAVVCLMQSGLPDGGHLEPQQTWGVLHNAGDGWVGPTHSSLHFSCCCWTFTAVNIGHGKEFSVSCDNLSAKGFSWSVMRQSVHHNRSGPQLEILSIAFLSHCCWQNASASAPFLNGRSS